MTTLRFPLAGVWGAVCAVALFALLAHLVDVRLDVPKSVETRSIDFKRQRIDTPVETKRQQKPERTTTPPTPGTPRIGLPRSVAPRTAIVHTAVAKPQPPRRGPAVGVDRDVLPLVRVSPDYPPRAIAQGLEGWVEVQFTITAAGAVKDAFVVAASPRSVFDEAAIRAIERWRYNPRIDSGEAVERVGMRTVIRFQLDDQL